jgi:hypothetical protein
MPQHKKDQVAISNTTVALVTVGLVIAILFAVAQFAGWWQPGDAGKETAQNVNANGGGPTPAAAPTATPVGETRPDVRPTPARETTVNISGIVRAENATNAGKSVVSFYKDSEFKLTKTTDEKGGFSFGGVLVKAESSYSLQVKAPGLSGEEKFTFEEFITAPEGKVVKNVTLRPTAAAAAFTPTPSPTPTPDVPAARLEGAQFADLAGKLQSIGESADSIRSSFGILNLISLLTLLLLAAAIYLVHRRGHYFREIAANSYQLQGLASAWGRVADELKKVSEQEKLNQTLQGLPEKLMLALNQLPEYRKHTTSPSGEASQQAVPDRRDQDMKAGRVKHGSAATQRAAKEQERASVWYQQLLTTGTTSPKPFYLIIDLPNSANSPLEPRLIRFKVTHNQSSFVLYREGASNVGWVFPNPLVNFSPDHKFVYPDLDENNFEQRKAGIQPLQAQQQNDSWHLPLQ